MHTLSRLRFKKITGGNKNARVTFGPYFVSVSYSPNWNGNAGNCYGDGKLHWEVAYGKIGSEPKSWTVVGNATRNQVNAILKNVYMKGVMEGSGSREIQSYFGRIIALPGSVLTGGVSVRQSSRFATRQEARDWLRAAEVDDRRRGVVKATQICPSFYTPEV